MKKTIKWKKGFKVVRPVIFEKKSNNIYSSVFQFKGGILYSPGKPTQPQVGCGPLAVFTSLKRVHEFINTHLPYDDVVVFNCIYRPKDIKKLWVTYDPLFGKKGHTPSFKKSYAGGLLPYGTAFASCIILTDEVEKA